MSVIRQRGFTLLEAMVVVGMIAVIATMAVPMYRSLSVQSALTASVNNFASAIAIARSNAVRESRQFVVRPRSGSWASGWCVIRGTTNNCETAGANVVNVFEPPTGIVNVASGPAADPVFQANGTITNLGLGTTNAILFCENGGSHSRQLTFYRSGSVTIKKDATGC